MKFKIPYLITALFPVLLSGPVQAGPDDDGSYSFAAEAEEMRRKALIIQANDAYVLGQEAEKAGDLPQAGAEYRHALQLLPTSPITEPYRKLYGRALARVSTQLAQEAADGGNLRKAQQYVSAALAADPDYEPAQILDKRLKDPEWYNPEYSQAHAKNVDEVTGRLRVAKSHQDIGRYDDGDREAEEVLRIDPYNRAARRLMEKGEFLRGPYRRAARDETRSRMLADVNGKWEMPIPIKSLERESIEDGELVPGGGVEDVAARLKRTTISIELFNVSIKDAVERLRQKSAQSDPSGRGISFVLNEAGLDATAQSTPITVNLSNVPLEAALRYIVDLAGLVSRIDGNTVVISSAGDTTTLVRRTYRVPPYFINSGATSRGGGDDGNPFEDEEEDSSGPRVVTAQQILEDNGIVFEEGANARFNPQRGELVVTNTQQMLELVAAFVDTLDLDQPKQVTVTARFVEVRQENWQELGLDWYIGRSSLHRGRYSASGGTYGDSPLGELEANTLQTPLANRYVPFNRQVTTPGVDGAPDSLDFVPFGNNPSTQSLRTGGFAVEGAAIDAILRGEGRGADVASPGPGILAMAGILTDPQFQVVLRGLNQKKSVDLLTAPRVLTKSGQKATIEVVRELIYPSEYDPPELPQNVGSGATTGGFPVTPANPTAFLTRNTGVTMEVLPVVAPDGFTMEVELSPEVVEFEGFVNYGSPIQTAGVNLLNQPINIVLTENRIDMPVFATRRAKTKVTVWDGATIAIGGLIREDVQHVQDKIPLLGDLPWFGRLFRSESDQHERRNLMIFVTAQLLDPGGSAIREGVGSGVGTSATAISATVPTSGPQTDLLPPPPEG